MELSSIIVLLTLLCVANCSVIPHYKNNIEPGTKIIETISDVSEARDVASTCSEEDHLHPDILHDETQGHLLDTILTKLRTSGDVHNPKSFASQSLTAESIQGRKRSYHSKVHPVRPIRTHIMSTLPRVYVKRPYIAPYHHRETVNYDDVLHSRNIMYVPVIRPERTTSDEEFWAELGESTIMKNYIPTMDLIPRDSYDDYNIAHQAPLKFGARDMINEEAAIAYYPHNEFDDCTYPYLADCEPKIDLGAYQEDLQYPALYYGRPIYRRQAVSQEEN